MGNALSGGVRGISNFNKLKKIDPLTYHSTKEVDTVFFPDPIETPTQEVATPIQEVQQSNIADETTRKNLAKRRRATLLNQVSGEATVMRKKLGAG